MELNYIKNILILTKFRIALLASLSTFIGFLIKSNKPNLELIFAFLGVLFLAMSASILNNITDINIDKRMNRTNQRPLINGRIKINNAYLYLLLFLLIGSLLLVAVNFTILILGITAFIWYNMIYTPLKRKTIFAVIPGSLTGAIPPIIGFLTAGGKIYEAEIIVISLVFYIWQIPHFWLLFYHYDRDYQNAGLPHYSKIFSDEQFIRINFIWSISFFISAMSLPFYEIINSKIITLVILITIILSSLVTFFSLYNKNGKVNAMKVFNTLNTFVLIIVLSISLEKLFLHN